MHLQQRRGAASLVLVEKQVKVTTMSLYAMKHAILPTNRATCECIHHNAKAIHTTTPVFNLKFERSARDTLRECFAP